MIIFIKDPFGDLFFFECMRRPVAVLTCFILLCIKIFCIGTSIFKKMEIPVVFESPGRDRKTCDAIAWKDCAALGSCFPRRWRLNIYDGIKGAGSVVR